MQGLWRETFRLRFALLVLFCLVSLVVLAAAWLAPRSYVSTARIELRGNPADAAGMLRELRDRVGNGALDSAIDGRSLVLRLAAASPMVAFESLSARVNALFDESLARLRERAERELAALEDERDAARAALDAAETTLNEALNALPQGGSAAAGARLGQLQAEIDALQLAVVEAETQQGTLRDRAAELEARIAGISLDDAEVMALQDRLADAELRRRQASMDAERNDVEPAEPLPDLAALRADLLAAERELAERRQLVTGLEAERRQVLAQLVATREAQELRRKRRTELNGLIEDARGRVVELQRENESIRALNETYETARVVHQDLVVQVQQARLAIPTRVSPGALPYELAQPASYPMHPQGIQPWQWSVIAFGAGALAALLRLLLAWLGNRKARSLQALSDELGLPALVEINEWQHISARLGLRWRFVFSALLVTGLVAAHLAVLLDFYRGAL